MKEVIKKEIIKLLDASTIYAIEDIPWDGEFVSTTDMLKTSMEVFMDDFSVFGDSFDSCLNNLEQMLIQCKQAHLVLNWEKCHFMVTEGIVLGHNKVSHKGLEVDKAKIDVIAKLPPPTNVKAVRSFLGHAGFYRRFIKDFSKISKPMTKLLEKDSVFNFDEECNKAFETLKEKLTNAPIMASPNWSLQFELMCDASDFSEINDEFPDEFLMSIKTDEEESPWLADFAAYLVGGILRKGLTYAQRCKFFSERKHYFWDEPYLFKACRDGMIRRCVYGSETQKILDECHHGPTRGPYGPSITTKKVFDVGFYWPTIFKEAQTLVQNCDACQRSGRISRRDKMPLNNIHVSEIFDIWGIDFMLPFSKSHKFEYILVAIDYVSKWAEVEALPTNDARVVVNFLKKLFFCFGIPKALIRDRGTHFCNRQMEKILKKYGIHHRIATAYHPQTSGQVKNTNRALKRILKKTIKDNLSIWSRKLDDALWAFRTVYKTSIGTTLYRLLYGKTCHLPFEIEHRAYWALRSCNPDLKVVGEKRFRLKWCGPFIVKHVYPSGYVELYYKHGGNFIVNGHRVKLYHDEEQLNELAREEIHLVCEDEKMKAIPFMAPFLANYRETMPWASEKPYIYSVVENTCNKAKLYDLDKTGKE
ncbi:reverse transcriptase domain-containing protein [Tanacetum coccineum]